MRTTALIIMNSASGCRRASSIRRDVGPNRLTEVDNLLISMLNASACSSIKESLRVRVSQLTLSRLEIIVTWNVFPFFARIDLWTLGRFLSFARYRFRLSFARYRFRLPNLGSDETHCAAQDACPAKLSQSHFAPGVTAQLAV